MISDEAVSAFDIDGDDRKSFKKRTKIVQMVSASAEVAIKGSNKRVIVVEFERIEMYGERMKNDVETNVFERIIMSIDTDVACERVERD